MPASIVQQAIFDSAGVASSGHTLAFVSSVTAGSAIHAGFCQTTDSTTTATFTDNGGGGSWTSNLDAPIDAGNAVLLQHGYAPNKSGGATSVTCTPGGSVAFGMIIREVGGVSAAPLDGHGKIGAGTSPQTVSATSAVQPALWSALGVCDTDNTVFPTVTNGTAGAHWLTSTLSCAGADSSKRVTATGSQSEVFTAAGQTILAVIAVFDEASGAVAAQPYAEDDRNEDEVSDEPLYAAYDSAPVGPAQPAPPVEDIQGGDELDHIEDEAAVLDAGASAPVGPAQPPLPVEDIYGEPDDLWDDSELWGADSAPVGPNQPALPVEDPAPDFEDVWDDIEIWLADSAPVGPNAAVIGQPTPDDPWNWEEIDDELDLLAAADSAPVGPNQPPLPREDIQGEPDDVWDDVELLATFDSAPVGPNAIIVPRQPPEDIWNWQEDLVDDDVDLLAAGDSAPVGLPSTLRVQAVVPGWYAEIFRDIGDVFDIAAGGLSDSSVSFVPPGNPNYPLYGWMKVVPPTTPLYSYALSTEGQSSIIAGTYSITQQGTVKGLKTPRTVV